MDPTGYLDLAKNLVERVKRGDQLPNTTGQAECRTAISRAYYSAFNLAGSLLDTLDIWLTNSGLCHTLLQYGLNNSGDAELQVVSQKLGTLYIERRKADYEMRNTRPEHPAHADTMNRLSDEVASAVRDCESACRSDPQKKAALATAILDWSRLAGKLQHLRKK